MSDWERHADREEGRYLEGLRRVPEDPDGRQKQLVRVANAAVGAGLSRLMQGRRAEAVGWFARAAERYRESYEGAPEGSWGRLIGAIKMRVLAGDWTGAGADASWALEEGAEEAESPIGRYAAALAALVLENDPEAARLGRTLAVDPQESFPREVAQAIVGLAERDAATYAEGLALTLRSFETRDEYLEDVPVADTVLVLDALAKRRGMAVHPVSELLPASA